MQVIYERCCGLDVHKRTITACRLKWLGSEWQKEIRQFGTMTKDLLALSDWLVSKAARTWRWNRPVFIGSRSITYWKGNWSCWWSTRSI